MKIKTLAWITTMVLCAASATPLGLVAQDDTTQANKPKHHHYKLIDIGTFGGPQSYFSETIPFINGNGDINSRGLAVGGAATSIPATGTSNPLICGGFVYHAFEWQKGIVTDLGALPGAGNCSGGGVINANGEIVGNSENGEIDPLTGINQSRPVRWKDGHITDLGSLGGNQGIGISINNRGQIVGGSLNTIADPFSIYDLLLGSSNGTQTRAFLWQHGLMQDLGTLGGPDAIAILVNEGGQIAGMSYTNSTPSPNCFGFLTSDPFLWQNGEMTDLGTLGGTCGYPLAMNNRGQVVGASNLAGDIFTHGFLWDHGVLIDLGTLGGNFGNANAINEGGEIVGYATSAGDQAVFAFSWKNGVITDLGSVNADPCSTANAINSRGQIVGISATCDFSTFRRAFLWENGAMVDLNALILPGSGMQLTLAEAVNDRGEIAVNGTPAGCGIVEQCGHAVLLIPCDENHPGVEGCDYSLVEGSAATGVNTAPAMSTPTSANQFPGFRGAANPMLRRFGRGLGPWYRGLGAPTPASELTSPLPSSATNAGTTAGTWIHDPIAGFGHHGSCEVNRSTGKLNGYCFSNPYCFVRPSASCPAGQPAIQPGYTFCLGLSQVEIDLARPCSFF